MDGWENGNCFIRWVYQTLKAAHAVFIFFPLGLSIFLLLSFG